VDVFSALGEGLLLGVDLFGEERHFFLDVVEDGLCGVFGECEGEVFGVLVDEAADRRH